MSARQLRQMLADEFLVSRPQPENPIVCLSLSFVYLYEFLFTPDEILCVRFLGVRLPFLVYVFLVGAASIPFFSLTQDLVAYPFAFLILLLLAIASWTLFWICRGRRAAKLLRLPLEEITKQPNFMYQVNWESISEAYFEDRKLSFVWSGKQASMKVSRITQLNEFKALLFSKLGDKVAFG